MDQVRQLQAWFAERRIPETVRRVDVRMRWLVMLECEISCTSRFGMWQPAQSSGGCLLLANLERQRATLLAVAGQAFLREVRRSFFGRGF